MVFMINNYFCNFTSNFTSNTFIRLLFQYMDYDYFLSAMQLSMYTNIYLGIICTKKKKCNVIICIFIVF